MTVFHHLWQASDVGGNHGFAECICRHDDAALCGISVGTYHERAVIDQLNEFAVGDEPIAKFDVVELLVFADVEMEAACTCYYQLAVGTLLVDLLHGGQEIVETLVLGNLAGEENVVERRLLVAAEQCLKIGTAAQVAVDDPLWSNLVVVDEVLSLFLVEDDQLRDECKCRFSPQPDDEGVESGVGERVMNGEDHLPPQEVDDEFVDVGRPYEMDDVEVTTDKKQQQQEISPKGFQLPQPSASVHDVEFVGVDKPAESAEFGIGFRGLEDAGMGIDRRYVERRSFQVAGCDLQQVSDVGHLLRFVQEGQVGVADLYFS